MKPCKILQAPQRAQTESAVDSVHTVYILNALPYIFGAVGVICLIAVLIPDLYCKDSSFALSLCAWTIVSVIVLMVLLERVPFILYLVAALFLAIVMIATVYSVCLRCDALDVQKKNLKAETALVCLVPFFSIFWVYKKEKQIVKAAALHSITISDKSVPYTLLTVFGLNFICYCLITAQLNRIYDSLSR